ncbi:hypothetical protein PGAG_00255 [Phaeocystis globosa virus 12T]|uniref:Holliday junction resolvase n=1 Tax=Phaeocystis globosa virus PgV-16T TaxID=3071227 RepID=A0AC59EXE3_9VIRU|nr:putative Holliday junction resolvase [Phaeocystis globosa virus]AET73144.1 hypothetical protein PGAG_00255 [Phaeocystis globosa virus 12T]AET73968.1 hypothetical protein PGBG_00260 [Phaeocystis globosa virus 14T]AGM15605.1 putative Holliday junction resolvase [Phaeocystis globosa virus PgV-16T]UYE94335.1 putative Holliday junction resolvase [Phaeocystis globosa virus]
MKLLSIDIGIKNLAFAILEQDEDTHKFIISKWDIINLCQQIPTCSLCKKPAKFTKDGDNFCKIHTRNQKYKLPTIVTKGLSNKSLKNVMAIASENNIEFDKKITKVDLVKLIEEHIDNTCFDSINSISANDMSLIDLGVNLKTELNKLFTTIDLCSIDMILLENQISPIANRMKTIQGMVTQYFIDYGNHNIKFMSAANKLKPFSDKKTDYKERKLLSIQYTQELLSRKIMENDLDYFNKNNKKDDLADCLLQGIYFLTTFNKLDIFSKILV